MVKQQPMTRRKLFQQLALLTLGYRSTPLHGAMNPPRALGKTGLRVNGVGFGGFAISDPTLLPLALSYGINLVDTSSCYRGGESERVIGLGLRAIRDKIVLATKWCPHHHGLPPTRDNFLKILEGSLTRLQTDYVDIVYNHQVGWDSDGMGARRLDNPDMLEAFEIARTQGKVRFLGVSGHDRDWSAVMTHAISKGIVQVVLGRYNFLDYPDQQAIIDLATQKGVGFVAMKTLAGAKVAGVSSKKWGTSLKQTALKWVLANPGVSALVITINSPQQVEEYGAVNQMDLSALDGVELENFTRG